MQTALAVYQNDHGGLDHKSEGHGEDIAVLIRWATDGDLPAWYALATEVSPIFRHPADMGKDPEFISYAKSKAGKYEALTAVDYVSGSNIGFIGFSRTNNRITWFGVSEKYRCRGVGSRLLKTAMRQLDPMKPITVETFPEGYAPGIPAKNLYRKFGFMETESDLIGPHDLPICRMITEQKDWLQTALTAINTLGQKWLEVNVL